MTRKAKLNFSSGRNIYIYIYIYISRFKNNAELHMPKNEIYIVSIMEEGNDINKIYIYNCVGETK